MEGYCLKCREKREMKDPQEVTLKNGRQARQGTCSVCGTKITVMGGAKTAEKTAGSDKADNGASKGKKAKAAGGEAASKDPVTTKIKAETKDKAKAAKK